MENYFKHTQMKFVYVVIICLPLLAGCASTAKRKEAEEFQSVLRIGGDISLAINLMDQYYSKFTNIDGGEGYIATLQLIKESCVNAKCVPENLPDILNTEHRDGFSVITEGTVDFAIMGMLLSYKHIYIVFYEEESNKIVGWVSSGEYR